MLVFRYIKSNHFPLANFYEALIFLTWCLSTLNLFLGVTSELFFYERQPTIQSAFSFFPPFRWKSLDLLSKPALALCVQKKIYGGILAPCILFIIAFAQFNLSSEWSPLVPALKSNWLLMHVSIMIFSYTIFIVGGLISLILLVRALPYRRAPWQNFFPFSDWFFFFLLGGPAPRRSPPNKKKKNYKINKTRTPTIYCRGPSKRVHFPSSLLFSLLPKAKVKGLPCRRAPGLSDRGFILGFSSPPLPPPSGGGEGGGGKTGKLAPNPKNGKKEGASDNQSNNFCNIAVPTANSFLVSQPELEKINYLTGYLGLRFSKLFDSKKKAQHSQINQWKFVKTESQMNFDSFSIALDQISYRLFGIGFPLFTLGVRVVRIMHILSGAVWANSAWGSYWSWDLKETASFVNWLIIAFYLHCRYKNLTKLSYLVGFLSLVFLFFNFFGISLGIFGSSLHAYGASS
uniref:Heme attachment to plastid cytochrome c n=1 Tax=Cephaleuros virescens TaxID=173371 RepID=UPI001EDF3B45|nr:Heme attachment to plastid cytochrome c [Cephaleuros virescens]UIB38665.1 Heme attachment to plastid cytochrome c [Cephaleuros virescens]